MAPKQQPIVEELMEEEELPPEPDNSNVRLLVWPALNSVEASSKGIKTKLPTSEQEPAPYTPVLYTFRASNKKVLDNDKIRTKAFPFYLQLDHTIAVIWTIFCPDETVNKADLGINQLQWALNFLRTIKDSYGRYAKDVGLCIDVIQDALINKYSQLSTMNLDILKLEGRKLPKPFSPTYAELIKKFPNDVQSIFGDDPYGLNIPTVPMDELVNNLNNLKQAKMEEVAYLEDVITNLINKNQNTPAAE